MRVPLVWLAVGLLALGLLASACGGGTAGQGAGSPPARGDQGGALRGTIEVDGSSTVYPITEAVAEEFRKVYPGVQVNVAISGTGGGFKRWVVGEMDINDASRPITAKEAETARANGIDWVEVKVAIDGLAIVVHPRNDWAQCITVEELRRIWEPGSTVRRWNEVRPEWPDRPLNLYGAGTDSGTFDYFTERVMGKARASRPDYTASEDDNVLVQGVSGDLNALGYFGLAYYEENQGKVKILAVDDGYGCIYPEREAVTRGTYPLSRPLFIYVNRKSLERPEVKAFLRFYLEHAGALSAEVGYVPLPEEEYRRQLQELEPLLK